jgi:P-type Cu2+ transporter
VLSGDQAPAVAAVAGRLGIPRHTAGVAPGAKAAHLTALARAGRKALMVGDGLNDAPALMAAHVSMAPASAVEVGRNAADFVFLRDSLAAVPLTLTVCHRAGRLVRQNFVLAILYNAAALPVAILGHVSPLIAALAMSLSSIIVVANALRLGRGLPRTKAGV